MSLSIQAAGLVFPWGRTYLRTPSSSLNFIDRVLCVQIQMLLLTFSFSFFFRGDEYRNLRLIKANINLTLS